MNSKWWFRGSSGPVSCSCQTSVGRLRGIGIRLLRAACLGVDGRCSLGRVSRLARLRVFVRAVPQTSLLVFACVCARHQRRRPSVCVTGGSVRVTVCVLRASESAIRGRLSTGGPLGLRITGGSCVLGGSVKPRVCACAKGTVGALGRTAKKPNAPLAPHPCVRRGSERACGRRVSCPPSSHSSSQEISALCPALRGHGGSREMR